MLRLNNIAGLELFNVSADVGGDAGGEAERVHENERRGRRTSVEEIRLRFPHGIHHDRVQNGEELRPRQGWRPYRQQGIRYRPAAK